MQLGLKNAETGGWPLAGNKTRKTGASVTEFLSSVENKRRREDGFVILEMMKEISGLEPEMWGPTIIGFGDYHYNWLFAKETESFTLHYGRI